MNVVLLSGGAGRRLWPISNDARSKQFVKLLKNEKGEYESMLQRIYRQLRSADPDAELTIATGKSQISSIRNQLQGEVDICVEPAKRDTFHAIMLATLYLRDVKKKNENETVVVCPVDPYTEDEYFKTIKEMSSLASDENYKITLMGGVPTYPSEKYGYIIPESGDRVSRVLEFKEKPDVKTAEGYIARHGLWNLGVFAFQIKDIASYAEGMSYDDYLSNYESMEGISFDYKVCEHEPDMQIIRYAGEWKDIGTWNTFSEVMTDNSIGDVTTDDTCENLTVVNQLDIPVIAMGIKDAVIAAAPDGILVADKDRSSHMKPYVDRLDSDIRFAEKTWGSYRVIDTSHDSLTIKVTLEAGNSMNYHSHERRDEVWVVTEGSGRVTVDGMEQPVKQGDVITIMTGCKHTVTADTRMVLIEVQLGSDIDVSDKQKHEI